MIEFGHTVREVVSNLALQLDFIQDTVNSVVPKVRGVAPPGYTELVQQVKKTFFYWLCSLSCSLVEILVFFYIKFYVLKEKH